MPVRKPKTLVLLVSLSAVLFAGNGPGGITGRVSSQEGAVVAGARIIATHLASHTQFAATTTDVGEFAFPSLREGPYRLSIEAKGFRTFVHRYVSLTAGAMLRLDTKLDVATVRRVRLATGLEPGRAAAAGRVPPFAGSAQAAYASPAMQQFGEMSHDFTAIILIDANTGWAVGGQHWDQAALGYKGTIVKTTNGGTSWTDQEAGVAETFQGLSFIDANQGWVVGTNGAILHTTDGGAHWIRQPVTTTDDFTGVFFVDANNGWATSNRPVLYDNFARDFSDWQGSMWHTVDGGRTWTQQTMPASTSLLNRIDFVDSRTGWAAGLKLTGYDGFNQAQHLGAIYGTTDGGRTWTELFTTSKGLTFTALQFVDATNGWAAGFAHGSDWKGGCMFHTSDGGTTWQVQDAGNWDDQVRDLHFLDRNRGYAVGTDYFSGLPPVWRTLDGGATWTFVRMKATNPLADEGLWAVAAAGNLILAVGDRDFQAKSTRPWDSCGTLATCGSDCECLFTQSYINPHYTFLGVFFADQTHGWVAGSRTFSPNLWGQVILATQDGGKTWTTQYEHAPAPDDLFSYHRLDRIYLTNARNGWAVGSSATYWNGKAWEHHGAILHTTDGGQHWTEQGAELYASWNLEFFGVHFLNDQEGWAIADRRPPSSENIWLAHTTNGGSLWSWVDTGIQGAPLGIGFATPQGGVMARDPQHVWAVGGQSEAVYTTDGGAHWTKGQFSCGDPICGMGCYAVTMTSGTNGWIAGGDGGPGVTLYLTTDGGTHWLRRSLPEERAGDLKDIQFTDAMHGWAAGEMGNLLRTSDGGATWAYVDAGTGADLLGLRFLDAQHGWAVGDYGTILSYAGDRIPAGQPAILSVANSASFLPAIAPATWVSVFGTNLSASTREWKGADLSGNKLPTQLDGVRVNVNGKPALVSYISPSQVNVLVPDDSAVGPVPVEVATSQGKSDPLVVQEGPYSPALFRLAVEGGVYAIGQTTDGKLVGNYMVGYALGIPTNVREARPGEIVTLYGSGFGPTSPAIPTDSLVSQPAVLAAPVSFRFGRTLADVVWSGLTASGLYQFNIRIPDVPSGDHVIVAEINGNRSQSDSVISVRH